MRGRKLKITQTIVLLFSNGCAEKIGKAYGTGCSILIFYCILVANMDMDTLLAPAISQQYHHWYKAFQYDFVSMGQHFGYHEEDTRDIINQFFLELLEKKIDPASIQNPKAYLATAFRRKLIDHYRKYNRNRLVTVTSDDENHAEVSVQDAIEQMEANTELVNMIRKAYKKLPARCRKVIDLKFYKGLTTEQIALQTGLTKRSVYNNLFEGIRLFREELSHTTPGIHIAALLSGLAFVMLSGKG